MYADFKITDTGDIVFQEQSKSFNPLLVKFNISQTKAQKIQFDFSPEYSNNKISKSAQKIKFFIKKNPNKYSAEILVEDNAINQLIFIKLKTVLGELPERSYFGSTLSTLKHKPINDKNLTLIEKITENALKDIIRTPTVKAEPYIDYNNGYVQTVKLYIYSSNNLMLEYILER